MPSISDDFNRADNASLGSDWTETSGDWQIASNKAKAPSASSTEAFAFHNTSLLTEDMTVECDVVASPNANAVPSVFAAGATDGAEYYRFGYRKNAGEWWLWRRKSGFLTVVVQTAGSAPSLPYRLKLVTAGSLVTGYSDGVQVLTYNNTTALVPTGFHAGIASSHNNDEMDNFAASSTPAPTARRRLRGGQVIYGELRGGQRWV